MAGRKEDAGVNDETTGFAMGCKGTLGCVKREKKTFS